MPSQPLTSTGRMIPFLGRPHTDVAPADAGLAPAERLRRRCASGFGNGRDGPVADTASLSARLDQELRAIHALALDEFYLALHDLYRFARARGRPALINGPGVGSAVAHRLGLSPVDPVRHRLPFEGYLDPGRTFPPVQQLCVRGGLAELAADFRSKHGPPDPDLSGPPDRVYSRKWQPPAGGRAARAAIELLEHPGLGVIARTAALVRDRPGAVAVPDGLPDDDSATLAVFQSGETDDVFGFGGDDTRDVLPRATPNGVDDLAAVLAVTSSLAGDARDEWLDGPGESQLAIPEVTEVLAPSRGVLLYHEQVMELVRRVAGLDPVDGMRLVKLLWKRDADGIAEFRQRFLQGARERGIESGGADRVFDLITRRGPSTVCRANQLTAAVLGYQVAWLKAHFPAEFQTAVGS